MTTTNNDNNKQRIFAYLRKSTKKAQQEQSISKQKEYIYILANSLNINFEDIEFFIDEGYSGFKGLVHTGKNKYTRQRKDFTRLLDNARKSKKPCKILVYDYSRLTRNIEDYTEISKLLGINNKQGAKVEGIYFANGNVWNRQTQQGDMITSVLDSLKYSEKISSNITDSREFKLKQGLFPNDIKLSKGLERGLKSLKLSKDMPYIRKAFEMKADGSSNKDIIKYLAKNKVKISLSHIADTLFKNRLYIGEYTLKSTGEIFEIKFYQNKKPIPLSLFEKANNNLGLKKGKYGKNQKEDLIAGLLKSENGYKFSSYIPKGRKAKQYWCNTDKIPISQKKIFDEFGEIINKIFYLQFIIYINLNMEDSKVQKYINIDFKTFSKLKNNMGNEFIDIFSTFLTEIDMGTFIEDYNYINNNIFDKSNINTKEFKHSALNFKVNYILNTENIKNEILIEFNNKKKSYNILKSLIIDNGNKDFKIQQEEDNKYIKELEKQIQKLENTIKQAKNNGILNGFNKEDINGAIEKPLKDIEVLKEEIEELKNNSINDKDLDTFINAVQKIFEHTGNMLGQGQNKVSEEDYLHLIKMITFELVLDTKKELKIKLFEGIDKLLFSYGNPTENGTPVTALRRQGPNH